MARDDIEDVDMVNRIKVVSEVAELVPILRAVDSTIKREVFRDVTTDWRTAKQIEDKYGADGLDALRFFDKMKLVETKWQTSATASPEKAYHAFYGSFHIKATTPVQEISDILYAAIMPEREYGKLEGKVFEMVGTDGRFAGDVADVLQVSQTLLKALVKRSTRLHFPCH